MNTVRIRKYKTYFIVTILMTIAVIMMISKFDYNPSFNGFFIGFGSSLAAIFLIRIIRTIRHPEWVEEQTIEKSDERNVMINGKAAYIYLKVSMILLTFQLVLYYFLDLEIPVIVSFILLALAMLSFSLLRAYYDKQS